MIKKYKKIKNANKQLSTKIYNNLGLISYIFNNSYLLFFSAIKRASDFETSAPIRAWEVKREILTVQRRDS